MERQTEAIENMNLKSCDTENNFSQRCLFKTISKYKRQILPKPPPSTSTMPRNHGQLETTIGITIAVMIFNCRKRGIDGVKEK